MAPEKVVFTKLPAGRYSVNAHRADGAVVTMSASDRKFRVPHDLAHFVVEHELKLRDGVFGTVMSGGLFQTMRIVDGPRRHDDRARGSALVRANSSSRALTLAEVLAGVVHHAVETGEATDLFRLAQEQWGILRESAFPYSASDVEATRERLSHLDHRWCALAIGDHLDLTWSVTTMRRRRATPSGRRGPRP